ncbi:MAG: (2Fe-2S) ferredoxin domain-containing protein [Limnospira sp. PMC 1291.21]|uniref:(2Fe-2S) ferredoxin domain-containing protein n=1 Tax=unclassified Limnospira TaxID=2642885 RepID=UPI0028E14A38|nr:MULTISPECIES: (2Fe-2S) ferredoxin domain-containing protein [unclassified Limnospira]MDT9179681.1 (2Fe-2S) ferredoxin domain-containing protein [Limnospira sp. PMC 1238.20]MDT9205185.1 (2Fe-2S) ferredoxin domain-containing protein [Limnospira sp. PMC 1243.20]MDT9225648.1 (2Fe-2S) ferredoxin domain-containing protein [Limnospira sp. PMC 1279.21]MDT9230772.1 (2Fe-2S) ferredoxin domain-containing protein [Limnospira sp. PMC 1242.20]MDT9245934.1 (2Fe-2S) ferredoxin domain-containing protein [Li
MEIFSKTSQMPETQPPQPQTTSDQSRCVLVCQHQSCLRNGSEGTLKAFEDADVPNVKVEASGCLGQCNVGPTVRVIPDETWYYRVQPEDAKAIATQHLQGGKPVQEKLNPRIHPQFNF